MVNRTEADAIGRLLGVVGILVAGSAAAFFYNENLQLTARLEKLENANKSLKAVSSDDRQLAARLENLENANARLKVDADEFNAAWNRQLGKALDDFAAVTSEAEQKEAEARSQRQRLFENDMDQLSRANFDSDAVERLVQQKYDDLLAQLWYPQLRVAERLLKPGTDNTLSFSLRNAGLEAAQISSVSFTPKEPFRADPITPRVSNDQEKYVIRFDKQDNAAAGTGRHGTYQRELLETRAVPPNGAVDVFIEIEDSAHLDWGWVGDLKIDYDGRSLEIPNARAVFVPGNEDSV